MLVDGKKFIVYDLDNKKTINDRIAYEYKVLPRFINIIIDKKGNATTENLISKIKDANISEMKSTFEKNKKIYKLTELEFVMLWFIHKYNSLPNEYDKFEFMEKLEKEFKILYSHVENEAVHFLREINNGMELLKNEVDLQTEMMHSLIKKRPIYSSKIEVVKTTLSVEFTVEYDIYELFNNMRMNRDVPFCSINSFYKILKNFNPPESWKYIRTSGLGGTTSELMVMKVLNVFNETVENVKKPKDDYYSNVSIRFESSYEEYQRKMIESRLNEIEENTEEEKIDLKNILKNVKKNLRGLEFSPQNKVYMTLESVINQDLDENKLIERILSLFPTKITGWKAEQKDIKGVFFIPKLNIEYPIFLDLVTNNKIFEKIIYVDEKFNTPKEEFGISVRFVDMENIEFNLQIGVVEKSNLKLIARDPKMEPGTNYVKVFISKCKNVIQAERYRDIFTRLLNIYNDESNRVISDYSDFMDFKEYLKEESDLYRIMAIKATRKTKMLKDIDPDQFIAGYARYGCQKKRAPKIMGEYEEEEPKEISDLKEKGFEIMVFPKDPSEGKQYYYACDKNSKYKFPALKRNPLSNNEKFPIIPCCFSTDHALRKTTVYNKYYNEEMAFEDFKEDDVVDEGNVHIYTTNKLLPPGRLGVLPKDIKDFFSTIDSTHNYVRRGVVRSESSILDVLSTATNSDEVPSRSDLVNYLTSKNINMFQNASDYTLESLISILNDDSKYLDVKLFYKLLCSYFKCNIFIFVQNEMFPFGILSRPNYKGEFVFQLDKNLPMVLVYEHIGTDIDSMKYPQCEIIMCDSELLFEYEQEVVSRINYAFKEMYSGSGSETVQRDPRKIFKSDIVSGGIDFYGKMRFLTFNVVIEASMRRDEKMSVFKLGIMTDPISNLDITLDESQRFYKNVEGERALQFLTFENAEYVPVIINGKIVGYKCNKKGFRFYIPVESYDTKEKSGSNLLQESPSSETSKIDKFVEFSKLAKYVIEYACYLFSIDYLKRTDKGEEIELDDFFILDSIKRNVVVDPHFVYKPISRKFDIESGVMKNKKLVVPDLLTMKKLLYMVKLKVKNNVNEIVNYSDYKYIPNYYGDVRDFTKTDSDVVIQGQDTLIKWIDDSSNNYRLYDNVLLQERTLENELGKMPYNSFMVVFSSEYNKTSKLVENRIYDYLGKTKKYVDLSIQYKNIKFIYIDATYNKNVVNYYGIKVIPSFLMFTRDYDTKQIILRDTIEGDAANVVENIKMMIRVLNLYK
jgi:hypothetical protein